MRKQSRDLLVLIAEDARDLPAPRVQLAGDVGFDLYVARETVIAPGAHLPPTDVYTGLRLKLPTGTWGLIMPRSSTHSKFPTLQLCSAPIDTGFSGPFGPRFRNVGTEPVVIPRGFRLAQLVILPAVVPRVRVVKALPATIRGSKKYGSTGT
jgi:dUTP pyrophosphatase